MRDGCYCHHQSAAFLHITSVPVYRIQNEKGTEGTLQPLSVFLTRCLCGKDQMIKMWNKLEKGQFSLKLTISGCKAEIARIHRDFLIHLRDQHIRIKKHSLIASGHERLSHRPLRQRADGQPEEKEQQIWAKHMICLHLKVVLDF